MQQARRAAANHVRATCESDTSTPVPVRREGKGCSFCDAVKYRPCCFGEMKLTSDGVIFERKWLHRGPRATILTIGRRGGDSLTKVEQ